jgi:hypothetical protein
MQGNKKLKVLGKSIPEAQYVRRSVTIRDMDLPQDVLLTKQSLLRWVALSLGVLSESESRSTVVPVLDALLYFQIQKQRDPTVEELKEYLDKEQWGMRGKEEEQSIPEKAIRYHLGKLRNAGVVEMKKRKYSFVRSPDNPDIPQSVRYVMENTFNPSIDRMETAFSKLVKMYS